MDEQSCTNSEPKFTRGEKCIFLHLVLTFIMIIVLVLIYATHLYLVNHTRSGIFNTRRHALDLKEASGSEDLLVGYLYLNLTETRKFICNTLLLQPRWSVCPAHCIAIRNVPSLRHLFLAWGLKYKIGIKDRSGLHSFIFDTGVKNTIVHPFFNRDSFENNIGLIEHSISVPLPVQTAFSTAVISPPSINQLTIIGWNYSNRNEFSDDNDVGSIIYDLQHLLDVKCMETLEPILMLRNYEFCVTLEKSREQVLGYGSVVFANSKPIGLFSWGEKMQKVLPLVILNVTSFQDWIKATTL